MSGKFINGVSPADLEHPRFWTNCGGTSFVVPPPEMARLRQLITCIDGIDPGSLEALCQAAAEILERVIKAEEGKTLICLISACKGCVDSISLIDLIEEAAPKRKKASKNRRVK